MTEAREFFKRSHKLQAGAIKTQFAFMTESQKSDFYEELKLNNNRYLTFICHNQRKFPDLNGQAFDMQMYAKGLILGSLVQLKQNIRKNKALQPLFNEWVDNKELLAKSVFAGDKKTIGNIDSVMAVTDALEKKLGSGSGDFLQYLRDRETGNWRQVRDKLNPDEAFVMFIKFTTDDFRNNDSVQYLALIVTREDITGPKMIVMPDGQKFDQEFFAQYMERIRRGQNTGNHFTDNKSYQRFWQPVETALAGKQTVYIMPDGIYHAINPGALQLPDHQYLCDRYELILINSMADFKTSGLSSGHSSNQAALFGDPEFFVNPIHSQIPGSGSATVLLPLPGTRTEVHMVDSLLKKYGWQSTVYLDTNATEGNLKKLRDPGLIVMATHGFSGYNSMAGLHESLDGKRMGISPGVSPSLAGPMLQSGVYLRGAQNSLNNRGSSLLGTDDGILTSYELSNMTFSNLNLIILSACETGSGKITSEGVYGLQRACRIAGAENCLISLWDIDDNASQLFISKFMEFHLQGHSIRKSLKMTQNFLRTETEYKNPFYWGAFICVGNEAAEPVMRFSKLLPYIALTVAIGAFLIWLALQAKSKRKEPLPS